ncbi:LytR family transcriptional regulator [Spongiactinospora rosea]|uniref:LytR family transcriptional regulator n=1 Tax=Spongiactinospora rosea TaxID=2248750 RepID=A0A366LY15_9ACTN|nr:LCP family protein [Spongiactinospora rosea]RBQ18868.1 LytR family transcriptional regulator [Spongiactinospora rosea]
MSAASIVGWTALSALVPGAAHLRAGRRRIGYILLGAFGLLLLSAAVIAVIMLNNVGLLLRDSTMLTASILAVAGALLWFALIVTSYVTLKPARLNRAGQMLSGVAVGLLCVVVVAPFAVAANAAIAARNAVNVIFDSGTHQSTAPIKHEDPWNGRDRVNFLLVGGDAAGNRTGVRTDSMTVASVDVKTGNTVMFSLPRNMQHVRFPPHSPLGKRFPNGFFAELPNGGLLNEVWQFAEDNPQVMGAKHQGPRALKEAIGHTLGLKIDYFALVNMYGFADLVDAIGGLEIRVQQDIKWGGLYGTAGTIKAGFRKLSGEEVLWYGRSRVNSDDFSRMARQRCVIGAFAQQATPDVVLANFNKIASATKRLASTDIPRPLLEHLVELALRVKSAKITSTQFVPPQFWPGNVDWMKVRRTVTNALRQSTRGNRRALAADVTASPGATGTGGTRRPTTAPKANAPDQSPTPGSSKKETGNSDLAEVCGL